MAGPSKADMLQNMAQLLEAALPKPAVATQAPQTMPQEAAPVAPRGMDIRTEVNTGRAARVEAYKRQYVPSINDRFKDVPDIVDIENDVVLDFPDDCMLDKPGIILENLTASQICEYGRAVIPMMASGFSQRGAALIFVLAKHLATPGLTGEPAIKDVRNLKNDKPINDIPDTAQVIAVHQPLPATSDEKAEARAHSYLAASMLRLFTKSEENYIKAFNHIVRGYENFYKEKFPYSTPQPSVEAIKTFTSQLKFVVELKPALYRILYYGSLDKPTAGLRKFLYEIHLANTGMHLLSIASQINKIMKARPCVLLSVCYSWQHADALAALARIYGIAAIKEPPYSRKMWRFGRIFDDRFMSTLQTKSCPELVYTLALVLKRRSAQDNRDILNIAQLANVGPERRLRLEDAADVIEGGIIACVKALTQQGASAFDVADIN